MSEPEPPRDPAVPSEDETIVAEEWAVRPEGQVVIEQTETESVPRRRPPLLWPWLLALLLLVLIGLGALYYFTQKDEKTVPAVIGLRQERAEAAVRDAGLDPATTREASSKPRGVVLAQNPDPGATVDEGDDVRLVVSNGPPRETVPDVLNENQSEATADLTKAGFKPDATEAFSDKKAGVVIAQDPKGGATLKEGSPVKLTVSKGPKPVAVPDVVGTTSSEATATLRQAGLKANVVGVPSDEPSGTVVAQSPSAGKQVKSGGTVRLNVAQADGESTTGAGTTPAAPTTTAPTTTAPPATTTTTAPQPASVPDVVGSELAEAARAFADQGLKVSVQYVPSDEAAGRVVAQAQPAGTQRKRGDTVQVNVSMGAQPGAQTSVPDVVGQRQQQGRGTLQSAGFEVLALDLNGTVRNESPIVSQTPKGAATIPRGSLVILYVGA
ncbi:MAG TPA: PASTA domain-containing protein [Gaiellaceae bacterium]|nr:PASTA domain-containing protein [Gaiellaceae bacterium]